MRYTKREDYTPRKGKMPIDSNYPEEVQRLGLLKKDFNSFI